MFRQKHPYLFWQLIGWAVLLADFGFLVLAALADFGEWSYPIIVFTFIGGLFTVAVSPIIVKLSRRRLVPENDDAGLEKVITGKISALMTARRGIARDVIMAVGVFGSVIVFIFAAYILGERVSLALGFACLVLSLTTPLVIIGIYSKTTASRFFKTKNGEKLVELTMPERLEQLADKNPRTLLLAGEPSAVLLNFFYNWLSYYIRGERLVLYKIPAPELCRCYELADFLGYDDVLLCIPEERLDLSGEKLALFRRECDIMSALPFSVFARKIGEA